MRTLRVPFEIDPTGHVATVEGEYPVLAAFLRTLIMTRRGERVVRPTYGTHVHHAVFEPIGDVFQAELEADIRDAVRDWEPDIDIMAVNFEKWESSLAVEVSFSSRSNLDESIATVSVVISDAGTVEETP